MSTAIQVSAEEPIVRTGNPGATGPGAGVPIGVQKRIDKAIARQREAERKYEALRRDLGETIGITRQLLGRCKDRLAVEDQVAILDGLAAIEKEHNAGR